MEVLNTSLFLMLNASENPNAVLLAIAKVLAEQFIWLVPLALVAGWMAGSDGTRKCMVEAAASGFVSLLIAQGIGLLWNHPRPFAIGLGHQLIPHLADASFPSDHLTLLWSVSFSFLMHPCSRLAGAVLATLGLPVAWARIYLGVHFPLDMVGAVIVAGFSAYLCLRKEHWFVDPVFKWTLLAYHITFKPLIRRGWIRG